LVGGDECPITLLGDGLVVTVEGVSDPRNMGVMPKAWRTELAKCECVGADVLWTGELEREPTGLAWAEPALSE
jgi:hypothetical protein